VGVGLHGLVGIAQVRVLLRAEEDVRVHVDQPGDDVEALGLDDPHRRRRRDVRRHPCHLAARYGDVHHRIDVVARVDDVAAPDQEVRRRRSGRGLRRKGPAGGHEQSDDGEDVNVQGSSAHAALR